jgi:hypothetical protein
MTSPQPPVTPDQIMQLGLGFWGSKSLLSAVELGLFSVLADGPTTAEDLQKKLGLHSRSARDFFDALVALGMLQRQGDRYANTPETDLFLDRKKPSYVGGMLEMANARLYPFWANLTAGLKTGKPQNEIAGGEDLFAALYADPARLKQFLSAMTGLSAGAGRAAATKFPWKDYKTFIDVGCAQGGFTAQVALAHPHLSGGGFDLPKVRPIFEEYMKSFRLQDRMTFYPGSFFDDPLPKADVINMGHILHDWDLAEKKMLIKKVYEALPAGGAFTVCEAIIDDDRSKNAFGLLMSLNMLIETNGGFDFTGADCQGWMKEAGFKETRVVHLVGPDSMVIGIK